MITIDTNTQSEQEVRDAFIAHGLEPKIVEPPKKPETAKPVVEKPSESAGAPGDVVPVEPADGTVVTEEGKPTQEAAPAPTQTPEAHKKAKGGFQAKLDKATAKIDYLQDELDNERGDKTRIAEKLATAQAELDRLKGGDAKPEPAKDAGPVRPKRPEMPDLAEFDYDQEKFQAAMKNYRGLAAKYDEEMEEYIAASTAKQVADGIAADKEKDRKAREENAVIEASNAFVALKDKDAAEYGEEAWGELLADEPDWKAISPVLPDVILDSEIPGHLMMHLYQNPEELERISEMTDRLGRPNLIRQATALGKIEDKLAAEVKAKRAAGGDKKPEPKPVAAAEVVVDTPPAKPKPPKAETPDAPIRPVGGRTAGSATPDYNALLDAAAKAGDSKEFRRLRALQAQDSKAKKAR